MTLETWKKEFYPKEPKARMTKVEAIEHSLRKWKGLTQENTEKHFVEIEEGYVVEKDMYGVVDTFCVDSYSCALCIKYFDYVTSRQDYMKSECRKCPLAKCLGGRCDDGDNSPYRIFMDANNPYPMITALENTLKIAKKKLEQK